MKRFGDVVNAAGLEAFYDIDGIIKAAYENYGHTAALSVGF